MSMFVIFFAAMLVFSVMAKPSFADFDWTGFYAGAAVGAFNGEADPSVETRLGGYFTPVQDPAQLDPAASDDFEAQNISASLFLGADYQIDSIVLGLEAKGTFAHFAEEESFSDVYDSNADTFHLFSKFESDWMISLTPRIGYAYKNSLFYVLGGAALSKFTYEFSFRDSRDQTYLDESETSWGWTAGLGYEYQIADGWGVKAEYAHYEFDDIFDGESSSLQSSPLDGFEHDASFKADSLSIGIVKHF